MQHEIYKDKRRLLLAGLAAVAAALLPGCGGDAPRFQATDISGTTDWGRDFALPDAQGRLRRLAEFRGKAVVLFFGYTQCPDVCPTTLAGMREVLGLLGAEGEQVQVVFVSLDPERDTPQLLAEYLPQFHPSFVGLRGDKTATEATAKEFKVFYARQPGGSATSYTLDHTAGSYVFDPQGRLRLYLKHGAAPQAIAADLRLLLAGK